MADISWHWMRGLPAAAVSCLIKKGRSAALPRKNLPSIFQNPAGGT